MKKLRVAILLCFDGALHKTLSSGLRDMLQAVSVGDIVVSMADAAMDEDAISEAAGRLASLGYDVIVTPGARCSVYVKDVLDALGGRPQLFMGARDPLALGLAKTLERPGGHCSGVVREPLDPLAVVKKLMRIAPYRKKWLLPFTPWGEAGRLAEQVQLIRQYVADHSDIMLHTVPVTSAKEAVQVFRDRKDSYNVGLVLEGCTAERALEEIGHICWEHEALLCGTGLQALSDGAACTMGGEYTAYIEEAYDMLMRFWKEGVPLGSQPVRTVSNNQRFVINVDMLRRIDMTREEIAAFCDQEDVEIFRGWV